MDSLSPTKQFAVKRREDRPRPIPISAGNRWKVRCEICPMRSEAANHRCPDYLRGLCDTGIAEKRT